MEEYHNALKTGRRLEDLQFTTVKRLQPAIANLFALALTLLNLRDASGRSDCWCVPLTVNVDRALY